MEELAFCWRGDVPRLESMKLRDTVATFGQRLHDLGVMAPPLPLVEEFEHFKGLSDVVRRQRHGVCDADGAPLQTSTRFTLK
jgi:hypothetical protein